MTVIRACFLALALVALLPLAPSNVGAWSAGGHRIIANIAYDRLDVKTRNKIVQILRKHPRFQQEFAKRKPAWIRNAPAADQDRWIFLQASIWPDLIRCKSPLDNPTWHYIKLPGDCTFETWITLEGRAIQVRNRLTNHRMFRSILTPPFASSTPFPAVKRI